MSKDVNSKVVAFRLAPKEYDEAKRIANLASFHGKIRNNSVNTLAKTSLFVRINEWRQIEYQQEAERQRNIGGPQSPSESYKNV